MWVLQLWTSSSSGCLLRLASRSTSRLPGSAPSDSVSRSVSGPSSALRVAAAMSCTALKGWLARDGARIVMPPKPMRRGATSSAWV